MVLEVSLGDQVSKVKKLLQDKCGILCEEQILLFGYRTIIKDDLLLSDYNIKNEYHLDLSLRIKGAGYFNMYDTIHDVLMTINT